MEPASVRTKVLFAFVAAFVAVLAAAGTVSAHQIDAKKLQKFDLEITRGACKYDPTCFGVVIEPCQKQSARVAQCKVHYWGELLTGPYDCEWIDQFKLARNSNKLHVEQPRLRSDLHLLRQLGRSSLASRQSWRDRRR